MSPDLEQALAAGNSIIGHFCWYDCRNASIDPAKLKQLFDKHGLDEKHFPDNIKPKHAFQKACRQAMVKESTSSDNRKSIVKLIVDGMNKIVYGVVDLDVNEQKEEIDPDFSDRVWLNKDTLTVEYDKGHPTSKKVKEIFTKLCGEYTTRDISRMIVRAVDRMYSVSLRDGGVIYFVPVAFEKDLHALRAVVNDIGECNMRVFAIGDGGGNAAGIQAAAKSQINDKIKQMKADIADLKASITSNTIKGKTVQNSIDVRLNRFKDLKERCRIMADALKVKAESLEGELSEVGTLIKNELMEAAA